VFVDIFLFKCGFLYKVVAVNNNRTAIKIVKISSTDNTRY